MHTQTLKTSRRGRRPPLLQGLVEEIGRMPRARAAGIAKRGVLHSQAHNVLRYAAGVGIHVGLRWQSIRLVACPRVTWGGCRSGTAKAETCLGAHRLDIRLLRLAGLLKAIRARLAADRVPYRHRSRRAKSRKLANVPERGSVLPASSGRCSQTAYSTPWPTPWRHSYTVGASSGHTSWANSAG